MRFKFFIVLGALAQLSVGLPMEVPCSPEDDTTISIHYTDLEESFALGHVGCPYPYGHPSDVKLVKSQVVDEVLICGYEESASTTEGTAVAKSECTYSKHESVVPGFEAVRRLEIDGFAAADLGKLKFTFCRVLPGSEPALIMPLSPKPGLARK